MANYKVNPYVTIGGGLVGLGLGGLAYKLSPRKSKAKLLAHLVVGTGLGAGAGALASLHTERTQEDKERDLAKNMTDNQLEDIVGGFERPWRIAKASGIWGALGSGGSRIAREIGSKVPYIRGKLIDEAIKDLDVNTVKPAGAAAPIVDSINYKGVEVPKELTDRVFPGRARGSLTGSGDRRKLAEYLKMRGIHSSKAKTFLNRLGFGPGGSVKHMLIDLGIGAALAGAGGSIEALSSPTYADGK